MTLGNSVVLISGGTSGIGAACAREFRSLGARVAIIGRDRARADAVVAELGGSPCVKAILGDIRDATFCDESVAQTILHFGGLHVLVNSAAVMHRGDALEISTEAWADAFQVNVSGTFHLCRAAIRHMKDHGGGSIVNVASDWGLVAGKGHVAYCACKGAVVNMTRALALDHAAHNIRVNVVCPGEVRTPMLASGLVKRGFDPRNGFEELGRQIPIGRVSEPAEQARCIRFLASDDASYMTGAVVSVDGGSTAH